MNNYKIFLLIISICLGFIFIIPQLTVKHVTPLDVEESLSLGAHVSVKQIFVNAFESNDRFRPVYNLQRFLWAKLFGYNSIPYYATYGLVLGLTLFCVWILAGIKNLSGYFLSATIILLSPLTVDNFWRLGTAEPLYSLSLVLTVLFLESKKFGLTILMFAVFVLSKESAVFLAIPLLIYLFLKGNLKKFTEILIISLIYLALLVPRYISTSETRYMSQFVFSWQKGAEVLFQYLVKDWYVAVILVTSTMMFMKGIIRPVSNYINKSLLIFMLAWMSFIPLLLKWQHYYLYPTLLLCIILFFRETNRFSRSNFKTWIYTVLIILLIFWVPETVNLAGHWHTKQISDSALTDYLLEQRTSTDNQVYFFNNPSLHNISGSWMTITDFGSYNNNFYPDSDIAWTAFEDRGLPGIDEISNRAESRFYKYPHGAVLITNDCAAEKVSLYKMTPLCSKNFLTGENICSWCVIAEKK